MKDGIALSVVYKGNGLVNAGGRWYWGFVWRVCWGEWL